MEAGGRPEVRMNFPSLKASASICALFSSSVAAIEFLCYRDADCFGGQCPASLAAGGGSITLTGHTWLRSCSPYVVIFVPDPNPSVCVNIFDLMLTQQLDGSILPNGLRAILRKRKPIMQVSLIHLTEESLLVGFLPLLEAHILGHGAWEHQEGKHPGSGQ